MKTTNRTNRTNGNGIKAGHVYNYLIGNDKGSGMVIRRHGERVLVCVFDFDDVSGMCCGREVWMPAAALAVA